MIAEMARCYGGMRRPRVRLQRSNPSRNLRHLSRESTIARSFATFDDEFKRLLLHVRAPVLGASGQMFARVSQRVALQRPREFHQRLRRVHCASRNPVASVGRSIASHPHRALSTSGERASRVVTAREDDFGYEESILSSRAISRRRAPGVGCSSSTSAWSNFTTMRARRT